MRMFKSCGPYQINPTSSQDHHFAMSILDPSATKKTSTQEIIFYLATLRNQNQTQLRFFSLFKNPGIYPIVSYRIQYITIIIQQKGEKKKKELVQILYTYHTWLEYFSSAVEYLEQVVTETQNSPPQQEFTKEIQTREGQEGMMERVHNYQSLMIILSLLLCKFLYILIISSSYLQESP